MYKFLVHVERENVNGYTGRRAANGLRPEGYYGTQPQVHDIRNLGMSHGQEHLLETWYFHDESYAEEFAKIMAAQRPGKQVYICNVTKVATAGVPKVTVAVFNEQGLVPL